MNRELTGKGKTMAKILLVEDNASNRDMAHDILPDLVLMDMSLPGMHSDSVVK